LYQALDVMRSKAGGVGEKEKIDIVDKKKKKFEAKKSSKDSVSQIKAVKEKAVVQNKAAGVKNGNENLTTA
jgi:hypothetical protein